MRLLKILAIVSVLVTNPLSASELRQFMCDGSDKRISRTHACNDCKLLSNRPPEKVKININTRVVYFEQWKALLTNCSFLDQETWRCVDEKDGQRTTAEKKNGIISFVMEAKILKPSYDPVMLLCFKE
jgi:hypothetical protein